MKPIYKIVFLKNRRLRPLVKIIINVSNFLTKYRTIVFFKEEKNLSGLLIGKKFSVSKATCPESVFKTVQVGSCAKSFIFFHFILFFIHSELQVIFQFVMLHTGLLHFEVQAMWYVFNFYDHSFLIIFYIVILYRNFELIFEFMAMKRAPICDRNVCLSFFLRIFKCNNNFNQWK